MVLVGSCAAGLADAFSDVDVLIERQDYEPLYRLTWEAVDRGLMPFLRSFVPAALRERLVMVTLQQVVAAVRAAVRPRCSQPPRRWGRG